MSRTLFNLNETYNDLAHEVDRKATAFARQLLEEYPDVPTRELNQVAVGAFELAASHVRLDRVFKKRNAP